MINSFFSKRRYFIIAITAMMLGGVMVGYFVISTLYEASTSFRQNQRLANVINSVNKSTISSKEFLLNSYTDELFYKSGNNKNTLSFDSNYNQAAAELVAFMGTKNKHLETYQKHALESELQEYRKTFQKMANLYREKGFKDIGVEGKMRTAVHELEHASFLPELKPILSLRRHEKDFILRKDLAYLEKYVKEWEELQIAFRQSNTLEENQKVVLNTQLEIYRKSFERIVEIEQQIGLTENEGLRQEIVAKQNMLEKAMLSLQTEISNQTESSFFMLKVVIWIVSCLLIVFFGFIAMLFVIFNNTVRKPVIELKLAADAVSNGNLAIDFSELKKYVLLEELSISIEQIIQKFRDTIQKVESISKNESTEVIKQTDENDEVSKALNEISTQFTELRRHEQKRAWHNEGLAMFAEIAREQDNIQLFSEKTVKGIVKYLDVNQASFFVHTSNENDSKSYLKLTATYAFGRKKFMEKSFQIGEGLVGQCFLEKESILITQVPENYIQITSGLGDANPRCIYLLACKTKDNVEAVLELASFSVLDTHQIEFLEKIGESIASSIYFIRVNERTSSLMFDFKHQTESLKVQEEEMRQNLEELNATQEEMMRREREYKEKIALLENELTLVA